MDTELQQENGVLNECNFIRVLFRTTFRNDILRNNHCNIY